MAAADNTDQNTKKKRGNPQNLILWKPGQSGNPKGRPVGARDRRTVILEAMKKLGEANDMSVDEIEELMQASGIQLAIKRGSFFHYKELSDGLYGKITDKMDVTSGGKTLADLIHAADKGSTAKSKQARKPAPGKVQKRT